MVIISGAARGADALGEQYAALRGYPVERFPTD
ncbi:MAG: SLOG family protein [Cyanophyceae cyanobacterium]